MVDSIGKEITRRANEVAESNEQGEMLSTVIMIAVLAAGALLIGGLIVSKATEYFNGIA
jgi:hypothetical protein